MPRGKIKKIDKERWKKMFFPLAFSSEKRKIATA